MKPGTRITLKRFPENNGRAQLWIDVARKRHWATRPVVFRILHPSGLVEKDLESDWVLAGTSRDTLQEAQRAVKWFTHGRHVDTYFGGYI